MSMRWHLGLATSALLLLSNCGEESEPTGCAQVGALFRSSNQFTDSATDASRVYVGDLGGRLWSIRLADGEEDMIAETPGESIWNAVLRDDTVYFTASPAGTRWTAGRSRILSVDKDGGEVTELARGLDDFAALRSDATHLYWLTTGTAGLGQPLQPDGRLQRMVRDGGTVETLAGNLSAPVNLELDGDLLFFTATGGTIPSGQGGVFRTIKIGGVVARASAATSASGLALDGGAVYFTSREGGGSLRRTLKSDPSTDIVLASGLPTPGEAALANGRLLYVPDFDQSASVLAVDPVGGVPSVVEEGLDAPLNILSTPCGPVASLAGELRLLPRASS